MSETTDNVENHQLFASLRTQKMQLCQSPKVVNFQRASSEAMNFCKDVIDHIRPTFNPVDLIDVIVKKCYLFDYAFYTTTDIYNNIIKQLPQLPKFMNALMFGKLIKDFGERVPKRVEGKNTKGRMFCKLKNNAIGKLVESTSNFRTEINNDGSNWINVGHVRKSPGIESVATRQGFLEAMVMKDFLAGNNTNSNNNIKATSLTYCDGDTQAMIDFIGHSIKKIRLCMISYTGLSNNPGDVVIFLKSCKMIKSIVVDHDSHIKSLSSKANNPPGVADSRHNPNNKPFEFKTWVHTVKNQKRSVSFHNKSDVNNVANLEIQTAFLQAIDKHSIVTAASEFECLNFKDRSLNLVLRDQFPKGIGFRERKFGRAHQYIELNFDNEEDKMEALNQEFLILGRKIQVQVTTDKNSDVIRIGITNIPYEKDDKLKPLVT
ncbi:hypothetical protein G6F43_001037 [Rhizopus delemar]|nr:hypothetical protein G6F43_001037 [Rhizopus delemar]